MSHRTTCLHARLKAIPEGEIAQTARTAGVAYRQLIRLRNGEGLTGVRLSTLEKLSKALEEPVGVMLGEVPSPSPQERQAARGIDPRHLERLARKLERVASDAQAAAELATELGEN